MTAFWTLRLSRLTVVAALVLAFTGATAAMAHAPQPNAPLTPGQVIMVEPLPDELWLPHTGRAVRLHYLSTGWLGWPTVVSAAMFVPAGDPPAGGWPVVSWAHGTVGVADACAPSTAGRSQRDISFLSAWLAAGYAVVATDYQGLGTPGRHPYLHGTSAALNVIDVVRAAHQIEPTLSPSWLVVGQSQGAQAALFTGALATVYAPELDFRGAIATAPPTQWRLTVTETDPLAPERPANPLGIYVLAGVETTHPLTFRAKGYLTGFGRPPYRDALRSDCVPDTATRLAGRINADVFDIDGAELETLIRRLEEQDIPIGAYDRPVYIAQGTADTVVYPLASEVTADQLLTAGSDVTFRYYDGADHGGVLAAALPDLLTWAADRFAE